MGPGEWRRRWLRLAFVAVALGLAVHAGASLFWPRDDSGYHALLDTWLYDALLMGAAGLTLARGILVRTRRVPALLLGAAVLTWAFGDVYWTIAIRNLDPEPFPTPADGAWLAFYPLAYVALVVLARRELPKLHASMWLDGIVAGGGIAALATAAVLPPILATAEGSTSAVLVNLAYPIADVALLALVVAVIGVFGWRPARYWWPLLGGLAVFAAVDASYLVRVANDSYVEGTPLDTLWPLALFLLGVAAWMRDTANRPVTVHGWTSIVVPAIFSVTALALLVGGQLVPLPLGAALLSAATLAAAIARAVLSFRDVLALADSRHQARTDELTGLGNRRLLYERLDSVLAAAGSRSFGLLVVDLDRFKEINDSLGHHVGDQILAAIGPRMAGAIRQDDVITRVGGDEFAVLLKGPIDEHLARTVAERIRAVVAAPFELDGITLRIDASVGIALYPEHGQDAAALLQRADLAMYDAKKRHSGAAVYVARDEHHLDRLALVEDLRGAITRGELVAYFQPVCDVSSGAVVGMEALMRWNHPTRGLVPPDEFIPLAEQVGLIGDITNIVLTQSIAACRTWRDNGLDLYVAVNLSPSDLLDAALADRIATLLTVTQLDGRDLEIEITENTLMSDPVRARDTLDALRRLGVRVAIDDFGTGYSSLAYLRELPVDQLKLDRSFVTKMDEDPHLEAIVASTVGLAHSLGLSLAAEGVETEAVLDQLAGLGADVAQGWHLGRPMPPEAALAWLEANAEARAQATGSMPRSA